MSDTVRLALVSDSHEWMRANVAERRFQLGPIQEPARAWYRGLDPEVRNVLYARHRWVLEARLGLNRARPISLRGLAREMGISYTRVREIEQDALRRLWCELRPPGDPAPLWNPDPHEQLLHWLIAHDVPQQGRRALQNTTQMITIEWLMSASDEDLLAIPGFGAVSLRNLREALACLPERRAEHGVATLKSSSRYQHPPRPPDGGTPLQLPASQEEVAV